MTSIRLTGTITAESPIMITRPEQGKNPLTMNVVRNQVTVRAHAIPGETIKGLLRATAFGICVDAARKQDPKLQVSLDRFYEQTVGGLGFVATDKVVGNEGPLRARQPLLSLFGAANPRLTGRLAVMHAIARPTANDETGDMGMISGTRRDPLTNDETLPDLLAAGDKETWARQARLTAAASAAKGAAEDARRAFYRAKNTEGVDAKPFQEEHERLEREHARLKADPEFQHAIQRPLPEKYASAAGTAYDHGITLIDATDAEVGLLLASLATWGLNCRIGGGRTVGYGRLGIEYAVERMTDEPQRRLRRWEPLGTAEIPSAGENGFPAALEPYATAWAAVEDDILGRTDMFAVGG